MRKAVTLVITAILIMVTLLSLLVINSDNSASAQVIPGGQITTDTVWELANGTHYIEGDVYVENGGKWSQPHNRGWL
jgi:hypothetical protein